MIFFFFSLAEKSKAEERLNNERTRRQAGSSSLFGSLPEPQRKARKQLTPEELEERRKKVTTKVQEIHLPRFPSSYFF